MYYAADYNTHPQYEAYWVVRFASRQERDAFVEDRADRAALRAASRAVRYARRHGAFYDANGVRMVPREYF